MDSTAKRFFIFIILVATDVSTALNELCPLHLSINRQFTNQGFHRDLEYSFELSTSGKLGDCHLSLEQSLPREMYVNADQLWELRRLQKLKTSVGEVNVEEPAEESAPVSVRVWSRLNDTSPLLSSVTVLPVHLRYCQGRKGGGSVHVTVPPPENVGLYCNILPLECSSSELLRIPCPDNDELCDYIRLPFSTAEKSLEVEIPVSNTDHLIVVQISTFAVTLAASGYVLTVLYNNKNRCK